MRGILATMLTTEDKKWVKEQLADFATKKEVGAVRDSLDILRHNITSSTLEKYNFRSEIEAIRASNIRIEEISQKMLAIAEGNTGRIADLEQENKMGSVTLHRFGVNIEELAKATNTKISG